MASPLYDSEPAERVVRGTAQSSPELWWSGSIERPDGSDLAFVTLERHGPPTRGEDEYHISVPAAELQALVTLLSGLVADLSREA